MSRDFPIAPGGPAIAIDPEGVWLVDGEPVVHPTVIAELVERLVARPEGGYAILAGGREVGIEVAEAPFVVRTVDVTRAPDGRVVAVRGLLSDGTEEPLDLSTLHRVRAPAGDAEAVRLACRVKGGRFEARLSRFATFRLLAEAEAMPDGRARLETAAGTLFI